MLSRAEFYTVVVSASYSSDNTVTIPGTSSGLLVDWGISLDVCNDAVAVTGASARLLVNRGLSDDVLSLGVDSDGGERIHL